MERCILQPRCMEDAASAVVTRWLKLEVLEGTESWNLANLGGFQSIGVIRLGLDAGLRGPGRAGKPSILKLSEAFRFAPMVR